MNDDEVITAVRQCAAGVRMSVPEERIISRGRGIRVRRRRVRAAAAGALAVAAGTALAITTLVSPAPSRSSAVRLTAWSVVKKPSGAVAITILELRDPAGLQRRVRADGIPVSITYYGHRNPHCHPYPVSHREYVHLFPTPELIPGKSIPVRQTVWTVTPGGKMRPGILIDLSASALPRGAGIQLAATVRHGRIVMSAPTLVYAQPKCTGS